MSRHAIKLAVLSAALAALLIALAVLREPTGPERATVLPAPLDLPGFSLLDQDGDTFTAEQFRGRWSLVFFGFTHCPDICPLTLQRLAAARAHMAQSLPESELPDVIFVSVDPERDSVASVKAYVGAFGHGIRGVTGSLDEIDKLTQRLGIFHQRGEPRDGNYAVDHSAAVVVINAGGEYHAVFGAPHSVEAIARDMLYMMKSS